jgi:type IV pilus assembly protein PilY1
MKNLTVAQIKKSLFIFAWLFGASTAEAAVNLSNVPLQTGSTVEPNILFILDDSGSMRWGFMPDELVTRLTSNGRNLGSCSNTVSFGGFSNLCALGINNRAYLASSHLNKTYFDPTKSYLPPFKADGTRYANSSFTEAWIDGYNSGSTKVNLATGYRALMDDYYYYGSIDSNIRYGLAVSPSATAQAAFYYSFKTGCSDVYSNSCYDLVTVADAQRQNFANWFSYYRTRIMAAKAGIGAAFVQQGDGMRVGYGALNATNTIISGVEKFTASRKSTFINWLHGYAPTGSTYLRKALDDAGKYYQTPAPWLEIPGNTSSGILTCRQNFTILMTDGYWGGDSVSNVGNSDNTAGSEIKGVNNRFATDHD